MKLTVLMLTVCLSGVFASTYAQTATLNVSAKNETLENVLKQIEKQSEFLFFYNLEDINKDVKISVNAKDAIYGFPSQIDDDPVLSLVTSKNEDYEYAEERRLFYVAHPHRLLSGALVPHAVAFRAAGFARHHVP